MPATKTVSCTRIHMVLRGLCAQTASWCCGQTHERISRGQKQGPSSWSIIHTCKTGIDKHQS
eukprot:1450120-Pleurochrysis_carterae.AAC.2